MKTLPTIARGNPFFPSCAITDESTGLAASGLDVTVFITDRKGSSTPIDASLSGDATERQSDPATTSRTYDGSFDGDDITAQLAAFDDCSVIVVFACPDNDFRVEQEHLVIPGLCG